MQINNRNIIYPSEGKGDYILIKDLLEYLEMYKLPSEPTPSRPDWDKGWNSCVNILIKQIKK
jgi:hypothetical protein